MVKHERLERHLKQKEIAAEDESRGMLKIQHHYRTDPDFRACVDEWLAANQ